MRSTDFVFSKLTFTRINIASASGSYHILIRKLFDPLWPKLSPLKRPGWVVGRLRPRFDCKVRDFATAFRVRKLFGTFEKRDPDEK